MRIAPVVILALACAVPRTVADGDADTRAVSLAEAYVDAFFAEHPEEGTIWGYPRAAHGRLEDGALAAVDRWRQEEDRWLAQAHALASRVGSERARLAVRLLEAHLEGRRAMRACERELWDVSAQWSWLIRLNMAAVAQPAATAAERADALARARAIPARIRGEEERLRAGLARGLVATSYNVQTVVAQLDEILAGPVERSPFYVPAARSGDAAFGEAVGRVLVEEVFPVLRTHRDFLRQEYLPRAPERMVLPAACYRGALLRATGRHLDPDALHEQGLREVARVRGELEAVARANGAPSAEALWARIRADPSLQPQSSDELLAMARATITRVRPLLARWIPALPAADVVVRPLAPFEERFTAAHYQPSSADGSRPATYWTPTSNPKSRLRPQVEVLTFHEAIPGHHLQVGLALENVNALSLARYAPFADVAAAEGWGLYAEGLAIEMGAASGPEVESARLRSELFRAARIVVDTGLAANGWSRRRAVDYLVAVGISETFAASEVDRYVAMPGQACGYLLGLLEIRALRRAAEERLGPRFDARTFHGLLLGDGLVPADVTREKVLRWIESDAAR